MLRRVPEEVLQEGGQPFGVRPDHDVVDDRHVEGRVDRLSGQPDPLGEGDVFEVREVAALLGERKQLVDNALHASVGSLDALVVLVVAGLSG